MSIKKPRSWRTTLIGILGAITMASVPFLQQDSFDITKDWKYMVAAVLIAVYGVVSKDAKVSGNGTSEPQ